MITSSANRDSFHAPNPNSNLNVNPTYIIVRHISFILFAYLLFYRKNSCMLDCVFRIARSFCLVVARFRSHSFQHSYPRIHLCIVHALPAMDPTHLGRLHMVNVILWANMPFDDYLDNQSACGFGAFRFDPRWSVSRYVLGSL